MKITKKQKYIGEITSVETIVIESGLVDRFIDAVGVKNPLVIDAKVAQAAGLRDRMLPEVALGALGNIESAITALGVKPKQVLHSKEIITVFSPLCVGDKICVSTRIKDLYEQSSGSPMGFVKIEIFGKSVGKTEELLFEVERILAIRGGLPR